MKTFVESVQDFVDNADWLSAEDTIAVTSLFQMAAKLDEEVTGPIMSAFGLTYRNLLKKKPAEKPRSQLSELLEMR